MPTENGSTTIKSSQSDSAESTAAATMDSNCNGQDRNGGSKPSAASYDPTPYIQRARVTRPAPPKPSLNPMQFVQIKPCSLYQSAQQQLKRAEEVKKVKEVKKEEPEDWQSNLDSWKLCRKKRVEHIIDRVVEVKKLEMEEHDRTRRKSKTFSEMLEERGSRRKLSTLAIYTEDEANDLSDLGIGTSSTSGKSSVSEDCDNHSVMSDNPENEKLPLLNGGDNKNGDSGNTRDYIPSPGYDTSSSTAPASSPDPCEYTYEGAIEDYKSRISRAQSGTYNGFRCSSVASSSSYSKDSTPERGILGDVGNNHVANNYHIRRPSGSKIEDRLLNFELKSASEQIETCATPKKDLPKVDILKRRELFEKESSTDSTNYNQKRMSSDFTATNTKSIKEKFSILEKKVNSEKSEENSKINNSTVDITTSIKDRLQSLGKQHPGTALNMDASKEKTSKIDVPVVSLKDRLSSLQSAATKEEIKKPVVLVDEHQLEMLKKEEREKLHSLKKELLNVGSDDDQLSSSQEHLNLNYESNADTDREDSGIHTTDVSCSVSQTDEQPDHINEDNLPIQGTKFDEPQQQSYLQNTEEIVSTLQNVPDVLKISKNSDHNQSNDNRRKQLNDEELITSVTIPKPARQQEEVISDQDISINEALEMAFEAIDIEENHTEKKTKPKSSKDQRNQEGAPHPKPAKRHFQENVQKPFENDSKNVENMKQNEPIYENINEISLKAYTSPEKTSPIQNQKLVPNLNRKNFVSNGILPPSTDPDDEPYYQIPKSSEPYYEVPRTPAKSAVPVYENVEIFYSDSLITDVGAHSTQKVMEPPKEKPPPPPADLEDDVVGEENLTINHQNSKITNNDADDIDGLIYEPIVEQILSSKVSPNKREENISQQPIIKRMNSTKRIKKEIRNKRSSFLGIEGGNDDESFLELTVAPPPDMAQLLQEEKRLERQLYMKAGLYDSSDTVNSRDSGVSENHSRQSSEPFTTSSEEHEFDLLTKKGKEIIEVLEKEEEKQKSYNLSNVVDDWMKKPVREEDESAKMQCIEDQIREQEEVLRVEKELLQLEQEELKRQRENLIIRENMARKELEHGAKMLMSANRHSLQSLTTPTPLQQLQYQPPPQQTPINSNNYVNFSNQIYQVETNYRKSMSDLPDFNQKRVPPIPPAKPMRSYAMGTNLNGTGSGQDAAFNNRFNHISASNLDIRQPQTNGGGGLVKIASPAANENNNVNYGIGILQHSQSVDEFAPLRNYKPNSPLHPGSNMSRHTLHALSAVPKPKFTDDWVHNNNNNNMPLNAKKYPEKSISENWLSLQQQQIQKRKSVPENFNYNKHWLIQEAEQRRIDQQRCMKNNSINKINNNNIIGNNNWATASLQHSGVYNGSNNNINGNGKPLPDSVIQTLTQRVQSKGIGERKRIEPPLSSVNESVYNNPLPSANLLPSGPAITNGQTDKILSVSGKKKCSNCGEELGRGAAMIIESLRLFYHINCFKCCVCHVQLSDGLNGTDVRVRNHKLHCHSCYSSDDGIKFSCV